MKSHINTKDRGNQSLITLDMNDKVVYSEFSKMAHYLLELRVNPKIKIQF